MRGRRDLVAATVAAVVALTAVFGGAGRAAADDGDVIGYGGAPVLGAPAGINAPLIAMASSPTGGYWLVAADGGVFAYGGAPFFGSTGGLTLAAPVVDMVATPGGGGYWMVAADGGVFAFGDAGFFGSMGGRPLNQPIAAIAATASGRGYWLVARDGGVFAFGDARFAGSLPAIGASGRVVDLVVRPQGDGYWIVGERGEVWPFGAAAPLGSLPSQGLRVTAPVVGGAATATGGGYWLAAADGSVFTFGDAPFHGAGAPRRGQRIVAIAARPAGGYWLAATTGNLPAAPGDAGDHVRAVQERLTSLGFWVGALDGQYGGSTRQAVMAFQKWSGLPRTGVADQATVDALMRADAPRPVTAAGDVAEVDKARQLLIIRRGGRVWVFNASTGSERPFRERLDDGRIATGPAITWDGRFRVYRQLSDGWRVSELGRLWRPKYFHQGIAVHGSLDVPAFPASHGCVRVSVAGMNAIWDLDLLPIGMPVWVYS